MDIDDTSAYEIDPYATLRRIDEALALFDSGDQAPFCVGDAPDQPAGWLIWGPLFEELARARDWVRVNAEADQDPNARAAADRVAALALDPSAPGDLHAAVITPSAFLDDLDRYVDACRTGTLTPTAIGRAGAPEAVLVTHAEYRELINARMRFQQSPAFLATLDPALHRPLPDSEPFDLEAEMSKYPETRAMWAQR